MLRDAYEVRTATEFYALLNSLFLTRHDDRKHSIGGYITRYERRWNTFRGVISRADLTSDGGFGEGLKVISKSGQAKPEFLLKSLQTFYSSMVGNIQAKD